MWEAPGHSNTLRKVLNFYTRVTTSSPCTCKYYLDINSFNVCLVLVLMVAHIWDQGQDPGHTQALKTKGVKLGRSEAVSVEREKEREVNYNKTAARPISTHPFFLRTLFSRSLSILRSRTGTVEPGALTVTQYEPSWLIMHSQFYQTFIHKHGLIYNSQLPLQPLLGTERAHC